MNPEGITSVNTIVNTIERNHLEQHLQQGSITLLMTEPWQRFQLGHIPGSQCFSLTALAHVPAISPVVLCAAPSLVTQWAFTQLAFTQCAYWLLLERDFTVWLYLGGLRDWLEAGCPLAKTPLSKTRLTETIEPPEVTQ